MARKTITGTLTIKFDDIKEYQQFLQIVSSKEGWTILESDDKKLEIIMQVNAVEE